MPWEGIIAFLSVALTALVGYLTTRRNNKSTEKQTETAQVPHIIDGYNNLLEATRTSFEQRFKDLEADNARKMTAIQEENGRKMEGYEERLSVIPELKEKVRSLERDKAARDEAHSISMKYIKDTFIGMRDGTVPPIIPVPELIAGEFDGNLISALLAMTAVHENERREGGTHGHATSAGSLSGHSEL